jgi:hypothetical protein
MALCSGPMPRSSPRRGSRGLKHMATAQQMHGRVAIAPLVRARIAGYPERCNDRPSEAGVSALAKASANAS